MATPSNKFINALRLGMLELSLFLLGMLFVRREIWQFHASSFAITSWQEGLLIPFAFIDGAIGALQAGKRTQVQNNPAYNKILRWSTPVFFFLFVSCCALSERLAFGVFPISAGEYVRTFGLLIVLAGMFLRLRARLTTPMALTMAESNSAGTDEETPAGEQSVQKLEASVANSPYKLVRYPDASGKLLSLCGLPLVFNAWLPVLALPGVLILLKWHINDQEAFRISQLGEPYLEYRKRTWNLIPYIY